ncbi:UNVERIFIED_CONTAM: hypothetical protein NCL1_14208 [Trichonephila clavipes]
MQCDSLNRKMKEMIKTKHNESEIEHMFSLLFFFFLLKKDKH